MGLPGGLPHLRPGDDRSGPRPNAIITGTPLDCNYCQQDFCGTFSNDTHTVEFTNTGKEDPKFNAWWVKKYCTFNGSVDGFLLYYPYFLLMIALILFALERVFLKTFKAGDKLEKFYNLLPYNVIPVVLTGADMTVRAPPHSYIDVRDFNTTKELAQYLHAVDQDDKLFASYFWWRDYYSIKVRKIFS